MVMKLRELTNTKKKLIEFVESFKVFLGRSERVHWCSMYLSGLLLDGERKSKQPMAQRLPGGNEQALQQFVNQSPWHYDLIQLNLAKYMNNHFQAKTGVLVLDDSSLPKKKIIL
jgi:SRSO17 transposase